MVGVDLADVQDLVHDDVTSLQFVVALDFCLGHVAGAWDILIEVVGVSGADVGDIAACLCEGCGIGGVGVNDTLDVRECFIEHKVGWGVGRRVEVAIDHLTGVEVHYHHI